MMRDTPKQRARERKLIRYAIGLILWIVIMTAMCLYEEWVAPIDIASMLIGMAVSAVVLPIQNYMQGRR